MWTLDSPGAEHQNELLLTQVLHGAVTLQGLASVAPQNAVSAQIVRNEEHSVKVSNVVPILLRESSKERLGLLHDEQMFYTWLLTVLFMND